MEVVGGQHSVGGGVERAQEEDGLSGLKVGIICCPAYSRQTRPADNHQQLATSKVELSFSKSYPSVPIIVSHDSNLWWENEV